MVASMMGPIVNSSFSSFTYTPPLSLSSCYASFPLLPCIPPRADHIDAAGGQRGRFLQFLPRAPTRPHQLAHTRRCVACAPERERERGEVVCAREKERRANEREEEAGWERNTPPPSIHHAPTNQPTSRLCWLVGVILHPSCPPHRCRATHTCNQPFYIPSHPACHFGSLLSCLACCLPACPPCSANPNPTHPSPTVRLAR